MEEQLNLSGYFDDPDEAIELAERNKDISTEQIQQDIRATVDEIRVIERKMRWDEQVLAARKRTILEKTQLVARLQGLLKMREAVQS